MKLVSFKVAAVRFLLHQHPLLDIFFYHQLAARKEKHLGKKMLSHAGNRTPAAAVKAPNPNH